MVTLIAELARGREAIAERDLAERELRRAELGKPSEKRADKALHSIFQVKPQVDMPILGDADNDVEAHLEEFEDLCNLANPRGGLMDHVFGKTLKGAKKRCYQTIITEARHSGDFDAAPATARAPSMRRRRLEPSVLRGATTTW